jgi:predicted DNA-binding transcriptional regulator AlpA
MTTDQVVRILNIDRSTLWRWQKRGLVPEPKFVAPRRRQRYWTPAEVERLRAARARNVRRPGNPGHERKRFDARLVASLRSQGLSWSRVADRIGVATSTLRKRFPPPASPPGTITTREVAKQLGCSRASLYQWITRGLVPTPAPLSAAHPLLRWLPGDVAAAKAARRLIPRPGGRRPYKRVNIARAAALRHAGASWKRIAEDLGCAPQTAQRALRRAGPM